MVANNVTYNGKYYIIILYRGEISQFYDGLHVGKMPNEQMRFSLFDRIARDRTVTCWRRSWELL